MTMTTDLVERTHSTTYFRIGAWCWIATGTGHTVGDVFLRAFPREEDKTIDDIMRASSFDLMGLHRTYYEVTMGFSLAMGFCMVFVGILLLWIAKLTARQDVRSAAILGLAMSAVALTISALLEPPPPIVFFSAACVAFGLSVRTAVRGANR